MQIIAVPGRELEAEAKCRAVIRSVGEPPTGNEAQVTDTVRIALKVELRAGRVEIGELQLVFVTTNTTARW